MKRQILLIATLLIGASLTSFSQEKKVSLLFAGDAMQHKSQLDAAKTKTGYDYSSYYMHIKDSIEKVDIAVVNFETTLPGKNYTGYPSFGSPDEFAFEHKKVGFDVFLHANNHCLDKGKRGLERTIQMMDSMEVRYTGTFKDAEQRELKYPMMIIKNGIRIAMLNYTYGTNGIKETAPNLVNFINKKQILEDLNVTKMMNPDIIIANMHWGDEYKLYPNQEQKNLAKFLVDNGVRLVIGSHPHVVQPIDITKEGDSIQHLVVYSLGNFVSGMRAVNTDGGMMVNINLSKDGDNPVKIEDCSYSLVWVHKPLVNGKQQIQLIPIKEYLNEEGKKKLGTVAYDRMSKFSTTAIKAIESMNVSK